MTLAYSRNAGAAEGSIMPAIITTHIAKSSARWPKSHVAVIIQAAEPVIEPYMSNAIGTIQAQHRAMAAARAPPISQRSRRRRDSRGVRARAGTRGRQRTTPCVLQCALVVALRGHVRLSANLPARGAGQRRQRNHQRRWLAALSAWRRQGQRRVTPWA